MAFFCFQKAKMNGRFKHETGRPFLQRSVGPSYGLTMEQLYEALRVMYTDDDPNRKHEADKWLREYRFTEEAWLAADQLLQLESSPEYALFFAAQTLHTKIQTSFSTLPQSSWDSLRSSLIFHITRRRACPKYIRTKLCLALAALAVQMSTWNDIIPFLSQSFGMDQSGGLSLLEVCALLPEECTDYYLEVTDTRRDMVLRQLNEASQSVLNMLVHLLQTASEPRNIPMQQMVFRCLSSWIHNCSIPSGASMLSIFM